MIEKILCIGDIVGKPGRRLLLEKLPAFKEENNISFVIANGENAASGSGITLKLVNAILSAGVDVITTGDHVYKNKDVFECIDHENLLRPLNLGSNAKGKGFGIYQTANSSLVAVVNLQGRVFMEPTDCPFNAIDTVLKEEIKGEAALTVVDMHAEATSEKIAMGWHLDGRVTAVVGTHTHVQTADECILPRGTAYITDLGMTGPYESVLGREIEKVLYKFTTQMPARFDVAKNDVRISGVMFEADTETGLAKSVQRVCIRDNE